LSRKRLLLKPAILRYLHKFWRLHHH